jgi:hypothetical protein
LEKNINKIMSNKDKFKILEVPEAARLDYQLKELLGDFLNRATGKVMDDVKRGIPFTENGIVILNIKVLIIFKKK